LGERDKKESRREDRCLVAKGICRSADERTGMRSLTGKKGGPLPRPTDELNRKIGRSLKNSADRHLRWFSTRKKGSGTRDTGVKKPFQSGDTVNGIKHKSYACNFWEKKNWGVSAVPNAPGQNCLKTVSEIPTLPRRGISARNRPERENLPLNAPQTMLLTLNGTGEGLSLERK